MYEEASMKSQLKHPFVYIWTFHFLMATDVSSFGWHITRSNWNGALIGEQINIMDSLNWKGLYYVENLSTDKPKDPTSCIIMLEFRLFQLTSNEKQ